MLLTLLALAVVLGVLIFVHEAGHFLAAKWAGIYVHRFSLGLGSPVPWLTFRKGETEYSISWLPLGGYVKMASREEDAASLMLEGGTARTHVPPDRVFESKPVWTRMIVILAGVVMNVAFAWIVFVGLALKTGRQVDPVTTVGRVEAESLPPAARPLLSVRPGSRIVAVSGRPVHTWEDVLAGITGGRSPEIRLEFADGSTVVLPIHPDALGDRLRVAQALQPFRPAVVGQVLPGSPAARAGIQPGDTVVRVGDRPVAQWFDLLDALQPAAGRPVPIEVARGGRRMALVVTPRAESVKQPDGTVRRVGRIGVGLASGVRAIRYGVLGAIAAGTAATLDAATQIVRTVRGLLSGRVSERELGGPILIGQMAGQTARLGLDAFLAFMALISVNLAVLNLLPIPVLDGGQFMMLLAEAVIRRPLPPRLRERLTALGLAVVVLLMGLAFSNDLRRVFGG